jgi:hypothetical protein
MDEQTTTNAPVSEGATIDGVSVDSQGQAVAQPETTETAEAVKEPTTEATTSEPSSDDNSDDVTEFLKKKGVDTSNPEEALRKVADIARNAEKAMHQKAQKASELEKTLSTTSDEVAEDVALATGQDPEVLKRLQRMEVKDVVREFWDTNPQAREFESQMIEELQTRPHLAGDLDALWAVVQSKNSDVIKSQGKKEALSSLAQKQQAAVPAGNAVQPNGMGSPKITPQNVDSLVAQNDMNWFRAHYDEINRAMSG